MRARIDNDYYKRPGDIWWNPDEPLNLLETVVNPGRVGYFRRVIREELRLPQGLTALEVGCGGGILCEQIAHLGFRATGVDPSAPALEAARKHASAGGLPIDYREGSGEALPFPDASFDVVFCCDVLEHVSDLRKVVCEIARVLRPGGYFFYDTINRTFVSKLVAIKLWQEWKPFAFMPGNLHVWEMFITPRELEEHLLACGFAPKHRTGLAPAVNPVSMLWHLNQRARGRLTIGNLGAKLKLRESRDESMLYLGWAQRKP